MIGLNHKKDGISLGLPNDWLKLKKRMKQINQSNIVQNDPEISV